MTSFIIFYIGFLNFLTIENQSANLDNITEANKSLENANKLILLNEITVQSVKNFVYTQDPFWKQNYYENQKTMNEILNDRLFYGNLENTDALIKQAITSNENLERMNSEILLKASNGKAENAIENLNESDYLRWNSIFSNTLKENKILHEIRLNSLYDEIDYKSKQFENHGFVVLVFALIVSVGVMFGTFYISKKITIPIEKLDILMTDFSETRKKPNNGKIKTGIKELYQLQRNFENMAKTVEKAFSTEQRLIRELKTIDRQKNEFLSMVSHELKTPLVIIMGYAKMMKANLMGGLNEKQIDAIDEINYSSQRLEKLIGDILIAQRLDMGKLQFNKEQIYVKSFVEALLRDFSLLVKEKKIKLESSIEFDSIIYSDKDRLDQIFSNLINNSMDFVPKKNGKIEVGAKEQDESVIFYVKDNGIGISKEKQEKIFKRFYQIDTSPTRSRSGSGLGLAICKGITEALGGKIWVESELGKGSEFYFKIPKAPIKVGVKR